MLPDIWLHSDTLYRQLRTNQSLYELVRDVYFAENRQKYKPELDSLKYNLTETEIRI